jgi:hypothetical protein
VNWSQIDIKPEARDILTWKDHSFLGISSTHIDTLFPSLYQRIEISSIVSATCALVGHRLQHSNVLERFSRTSCEPLYATGSSYCKKRKSFLKSNICIDFLCPQKRTTEPCSSVVQTSSTAPVLTPETSL